MRDRERVTEYRRKLLETLKAVRESDDRNIIFSVTLFELGYPGTLMVRLKPRNERQWPSVQKRIIEIFKSKFEPLEEKPSNCPDSPSATLTTTTPDSNAGASSSSDYTLEVVCPKRELPQIRDFVLDVHLPLTGTGVYQTYESRGYQLAKTIWDRIAGPGSRTFQGVYFKVESPKIVIEVIMNRRAEAKYDWSPYQDAIINTIEKEWGGKWVKKPSNCGAPTPSAADITASEHYYSVTCTRNPLRRQYVVDLNLRGGPRYDKEHETAVVNMRLIMEKIRNIKGVSSVKEGFGPFVIDVALAQGMENQWQSIQMKIFTLIEDTFGGKWISRPTVDINFCKPQ